jgi:hypothetical protein
MARTKIHPPAIELPDVDASDVDEAPDTPTPAISAATQAMVDRREADEIASEQILAKAARDEPLSVGERLFLRSVAPPDAQQNHSFDRWLKGQTKRLQSILNRQAVAGSSADRRRAAELVVEARERYAEQAPDIQQRIAELQAQLAELAGAVRSAESDVERRNQAVDYLLQERFLPPRIREAITVMKKSYEPDKRRFLRCESDIRALSGALLLSPETAKGREAIECHLSLMEHPSGVGTWKDKVFPLAHPPYTPNDSNPRTFDHVEWAAYCDIVRARLVDLRREVEELAPLQDQHREEVAALARYLVPA